ncbi:MAG TPA: hypothetical protein DCM45_00280 [Clostridiales bacterium]|nr:hypothetical protein [Clostridiales bacterium]
MVTGLGKIRRMLRLPAVILAFLLLSPLTGCSLIPSDITQSWPSAVEPTTTGLEDADIVPGHLLISEVMTANRSTLQSADLTTPDWIEIHNAGLSAIELNGYTLSDNLKNPDKWTFPDITIAAGGYLLIYATGQPASPQAQAAGEIHAGFRLDDKGDELVLVSPTGQLLARLALPELPSDISYGMTPSAQSALDPYYYYGKPTPGLPNGDDGQLTPEAALPNPQYSLAVNEYMTSNTVFPTADGSLPDYVELLNTGDTAVHLLGFQLSDDPDRPDQWVFPDITLEAGGLLAVWLSGQGKAWDPAEPTSLQASFRLGRKDQLLLLADPDGHVVIRQDIESLPDNIAKGRSIENPDVWLYYPQGTPGTANTTQGFPAIAGAMTLKNRGIWINEVMAENSSVTASGKVESPDWIELYNGTTQAIDLTGYGISDDFGSPFQMVLQGLSIGPGEYQVIEPTTFGLSTQDETVYLTRPDKSLADTFATGALRNGISSGRGNSGGDEPAGSRFFYTSPTRGKVNSTSAVTGIALSPVIHVTNLDSSENNSIYFSGSAQATLASTQPGVIIRYTLDGSTPTASSPVYQQPLTISRNTVIRCRSERADSLPSDVVSQTLITGVQHDLPVVSIAVQSADFTGPNGVWTDFSHNHEAPAQISFYEQDGTFGISFNSGVALHGAYSRKEIQKSLELNLRETYGDRQVIYPFFPDNEISTFKRLILRTSSQDWKFSKIRDAYMSELVENDLAVDTMDWRPCVLYVNGEYYGLYEIRENIDEYYMASHFGTDPAKVDIIKGNAIVLEGSMTEYYKLLNYVKAHDLTSEDAYQHVLNLIDEQSLIDWLIAESFFNNLDNGNKKFWRERTDGAQWRWAFFDLDWGLFPDTYKMNILTKDLLDPAGHGQSNFFDSSLQVKLMENPAFKEMFIERYAELINSTFQTERMLTLFDSMVGQIRSEMPRQIKLWGMPYSVAVWEKNIAELRRIISEKRARMIVIVQDSFGLSAERMRVLFPEDT